MSYIDWLIDCCNKAKNATPTKEFVLKDIDKLTELDGLKKAFIYIIEEIGGDKDKTFDKFSQYKEREKEIACPKLNAASQIMYVGSSLTNIKGRIKQHIEEVGDGSGKTYALHLNDWFDGKYQVTIRQYDGVERGVLQIIEDDLSDQLKPAFGKKGGNNK
jgi:hypothetical protein